MPELPEVEVTRQSLLPVVQHAVIKQLIVRQAQLRWPIPSKQLAKTLKNAQILSISRRGKYLLFEVANGFFLIHLGMSGHLKFLSTPAPLDKHDHVEFIFDTDARLRYYDPRRFGAVLWLGQHPFEHPLLAHLGCEPLSPDFNATYLFEKSRKSKLAVKTFLMDQKIVVGIGNIYASESLFLAGIHPLRPAHQLLEQECKTLVQAAKKILKKAITQGGTTLKDFAHTDGKPGYFSHSLQVYGKADMPCTKCKKLIIQLRINQRSSYFCEYCQQ
ncbi:MAG: bifunctional DNA-formamidopyrimidine glycosylase/DNA-(apurinic or apyrimidinic site) lyase [Candidatus Berkiella sp.]